MNEKALYDLICSSSSGKPRGLQPPFAELPAQHPDGYEDTREDLLGKVFNNRDQDYVFHAHLGTPHIDVIRFLPTQEHPFYCWATNGMSDFPQLMPDGRMFRSELVAFSRSEDSEIAELLKTLGQFPFENETWLYRGHSVPFPSGLLHPQLVFALLTPPYLAPDLSELTFLGEELSISMVIGITEKERELAVQQSSRALYEGLPDELETWLIDARVPC